MKGESKRMFRSMIAQVLTVVMIMMSVLTIPPAITQAATQPELTKTAINILEGKQYNLNIKNKAHDSTYEWATSDEMITTVSQRGTITGIKEGVAIITCKVFTPDNLYYLTCEVTVSKSKNKGKVTPIPTVSPSPVPTATPVPLPVFDDLNQAQIVEAMGAGWNLGNQLEAVINRLPGETNWGNPVITENLIKSVKEAGFNTIRIPVSYLDYIGPGPDYTVNDAWLDRVQEVVNYCMTNDMYAIINMHGDGYKSIDGGWLICDSEDQDTIKAKYQAVWEQIATRFKDYDEHLIFESMNEEFDGSYGDPILEHYANINAYNQIFVDTVRKSGGNNDKRWVLIPGWNTNINYTVGDYGFEMPTDEFLSDSIPSGEKRIMISVHYYAPWDFCGGETGEITQWGESATDSAKVSTHSGQSYMAAQFKLLYDSFTSKGYPVVIGEYGSIDKSDFDPQSSYYRSYFARKVSENSVKYGCIPVIWDNGHNGRYGFALFNRNTCEVTQPEIIAAIMEAYNGGAENGSSTGITLDQSSVNMIIGGTPVTLHATLTPDTSTDNVRWTSSDETVATVSDSGVVRAYTLGTTVIAAIANGHAAECTVTVEESENVMVALYALETNSWSTIKSSTNAEVTENGGAYTLTLTGSQTMLSNIGALYIKDVQVQSGTATRSLFTGAKILINSVKFNNVDCTVTQSTAQQAINSGGTLDFSILNQWSSNSEKISDAALNGSGSYYLTAAEYQEVNTIEVTFTVSEVVVPTVTPTPTATPTPTEVPTTVATATPLTSITYDFTVANAVSGSSLTFKVVGAPWTEITKTINLTGDGEYSVTVDFADAPGMINMGYFETISGSTTTATLTKITVNGTYEMSYNAVLDIGTSWNNGLKNIWSGLAAGTKIAEGTDCYLQLNSDKSAFVFYVVS